MEPIVHAFWAAKSGTSADEYEDAFAFSTTRRRFAVADGATESSFADRWAQSLVRQYIKEPPRPLGGRTELPEWIAPLQQEWHKSIEWERLAWFAEEKARLGAFATFLGVTFSGPGTRKSASRLSRFFGKKPPEQFTWKACAVGDSCLFQVRGQTLVKSFPVNRAADFGSRPVLLSSNPANNGPVWPAVRLEEGKCQAGDAFFALTDALAKWFLDEVEKRNRPWERLLQTTTQQEFDELVQELRNSKALRNDDTTMLSVQWQRESNAAVNTGHSSRRNERTTR